MSYFEIKASADPKIIGKRFPQISSLGDETYDRESQDSIFRANLWGEVRPSLIVPTYVLHGHAKLTDLISNGHHSHLLLISERLKTLIETFSIPKAQVFKTEVIARNKTYPYFIFYIPVNYYQAIDFVKSSFVLAPSTGRPVEIFPVNINSIKEFENYVEDYPYLVKSNPTKLKVLVKHVFFDSNRIQYDFFRMIGPVSGYFVSEKLKNAIIENGYTGMEFTPLDEIRTVLPPV